MLSSLPANYLANAVRLLGKPGYVHRNAFSLEMLALLRACVSLAEIDPNKIVIGYASGTPTHDQDFALVTPALTGDPEPPPQC